MGRKRDEPVAMPLREELEALTRYYHRLAAQRTQLGLGSARRHLEDHMADVRERFERRLHEWVPDEDLRDAWCTYLDNRGPEPDAPAAAIRRLVFRGRAEASGSVVEVTGRGDLRVEVDGALTERIAGEKDFTSELPGLRWRLNGTEFEEMFAASPDALDALAESAASGGRPPWEFASELFADGLIDGHFELTRRGRRALAARR